MADVEAYRTWYVRTADTRAAAERADAELKSRGIEWLDAHHAGQDTD